MECQQKTSYIASDPNASHMNTTERKDKKLLTINELFEKYAYANKAGWTQKDIEFLYERKLIKGDNENGELKILAKTFEKFIEFHKKQNG